MKERTSHPTYTAGDIQVVRYPLKMPDGSLLQRTFDLKAINDRMEAHIGDKARRRGQRIIAASGQQLGCALATALEPSRSWATLPLLLRQP